MLRIVTGPFHPTLDRLLIEDVRALKADELFAPLAIVVPSTPLAERLKRLFAIESKVPMLNLHVLTFHQFALRLRDDLLRSGHPIPALQLVDDFYFEQLLRQIVQRKLSGLEALSQLPPSPGTWQGLWATIRDLKDAAVNPATVLKAVVEGLFEEYDHLWLRSLFTLQAAMLEGSRSLGVGSADDLVTKFGTDLSHSSFLARLRHVFYFGFYDLLQVQLSFFESIARCAPVTLYFPLGTSRSYGFARRFFERHLLPLADRHDDLSRDLDGEFSPERVELTVTNVIGAEEELAVVCREILTLIEVHGYQFDDIGVVARSFEPYHAKLQTVFDRHLVPFTSTAGRPLSREPVVKTLLRLASLPSNDFERRAVLDVLASPYARVPEGCRAVERRPDIWRFIASTLGITKGAAEWSRLSAGTALLILQEAAAGEEGSTPGRQDSGQIALLGSLVTNLIQDCNRLPRRGSIKSLTESFVVLVRKHLVIPGLTDEEPHEAVDGSASGRVGQLVRRALERVSELDPVCAELSWEEWTELFRLALEDATIPIEADSHQGVWVLDAMEARGLPFRALFVLGLNEQLFPRLVREDPFLRDRQRFVLSSTLGFLIEEKLAGHEEERLLFELLSCAATNRLYLSYQRADEEGHAMVPSALVATAQRDPRFITGPERLIPRRLTERVGSQPRIQELLPIQDLAINLLLHKQGVGSILDRLEKDRHLFEEGLAAQAIMERELTELGPFDGILGEGLSASQPFDHTSLSPTSLERYATCPFQYFAEMILRLEPARGTRDDQLPALTLGTLIHDTLRASYENLTVLQWPEVSLDQSVLQQVIEESAAAVFSAHAATRGTGHTLLWKMAEEQVIELVLRAAEADREDFRTTRYRPRLFEREVEGLVPLGIGGKNLKVHGKLDRIDVRLEPPSLRIIDYKFKEGNQMKTEDRNLLLGAARGIRLQPPLYASMTLPSLPAPVEVQFMFLAPRWEPPIARSIFERELLSGKTGDVIVQTLQTLVHGIERQEFFILPDGYCDHCLFASACRRHDQAVWWRSYRSPQARSLRRLRKLKVADE